MARLAIFLDGGYLDALSRHEFYIDFDFEKLSEEMTRIVGASTPEPVDLLRAYYYNCLPYQSNPPTDEERRRFGEARNFFSALSRLRRFEVREGRLAKRGINDKGEPIFEQKRVDLLLGLDFALLSGKSRITHAALVAGDSDLIPACMVAKQEGISVWLFHGPRISKTGGRTFHQDLWDAADERYEIDRTFAAKVSRPRR